ncbi:MAG: DUF6057 family protein [Parabacteroides distasonis]
MDRGNRIPRHFQEAGLLLADKDRISAFRPIPIQPEIVDRYREFKQVLGTICQSRVDVSSIHQQFGDTYWYYFYFKIFKGEEQ